MTGGLSVVRCRSDALRSIISRRNASIDGIAQPRAGGVPLLASAAPREAWRRCGPRGQRRVSVGHRYAEHFFQGAHLLRDLFEAALPERLHAVLDGGALEVERGRPGENLLADAVAHRHDLVEGDAAAEAGAAAVRAAGAAARREGLTGPAHLE